MARANALAKTLTPYPDNWTIQRVRDQIVFILNTIPRDWYMEDKRVEKVISDFVELVLQTLVPLQNI